MQLQIGERIGDYEVVEVLGAGGMGRVYKVRNLISDRIEALKVLLPDLQGEPALVDRFLREIKVQATLSHPNIASLHTALRHNNQLLMLMEFVDGQSVEKELSSLGRLPVDKATAYVEQVLRALAYAHSRGVIHRDIKPANIVVTPEGHVKLMDFGIAKLRADKRLTQTGTTLGSIYYMSPEQINGAELDPRSDVYSLGITMYEMVTGKRPFEGPSDYSVMAGHLQMRPAAPVEIVPNVPPLLNEVILMALAKEPQQRFQSAEAFRTAILNVRSTMQMGASPSAAAATRTTLMASGGGSPTVPGPLPATAPAQGADLRQQPPPPRTPPAAPVAPAGSHAPVSAGPPVEVVGAPSSRGLWMALGSLVAIGVLAVGLLVGPKFFSSSAQSNATDGNPQTPAVQPQSDGAGQSAGQPPTQPSSQVEAPPAVRPSTGEQSSGATRTPPVDARPARPQPNQPPGGSQSRLPEPPASSGAVSSPTSPATVSPQPAQVATQPVATQPPAQQPARPAVDSGALNEQQDRMIKMGSRAVAVRDKLKRLQTEQSAMGLGMRSDFKAALTRMEQYLDLAEDAIKGQEPAKAKQNLDRADRDLEFLEEKLGII